MNIIPIAFCFDNNMLLPACVCISSLMMHAKEDTFYDIFILHASDVKLKKDGLNKVESHYKNCRINYREIKSESFEGAFEIRDITKAAYYRLLIPQIISEYDKILYSDVDVIFRCDLADIFSLDLKDNYIGGVNAMAELSVELILYYKNLNLNPGKIVYSGNLIINSKAILNDSKVEKFVEYSRNKYEFQDMDVLNIVCEGKILFTPPLFCVTTFLSEYYISKKREILNIFSEKEIENALKFGVVHYNGYKPWKHYCVRYDIWWEYYRKSPVFDEEYYFKFFFDKTMWLDSLPLIRRIKLLIKYFVNGRYKS